VCDLKQECYFSKVKKGVGRNRRDLFYCSLITISPSCDGCIYFIDLNNENDMRKITRNQKILDDLKRKVVIKREVIQCD